MRSTLFNGLALACLFGAEAVAEGGINPKCADMALKREFVSASYIDHGAPEVSVGDVRIAKWKVWDLGRQNEAPMHVVATIVDALGDGEWDTLDDAVVRFGNGTIRASASGGLSDPQDVSTGEHAPRQWAVLGGTGVFGGVRGTISTVPGEDGLSEIKFSINCASPGEVVPDIRVLSTDTFRGVAPARPPAAAKPDRPLIPTPLGDRIYR